MKKIIYVCLLAVLAISFGCEKDEIVNQADSVLEQENQKRGDTGFGNENGIIFDGTNYNIGPPNGEHWTLLITYSPGVTETEKQQFRFSYQVTGELWYYEQCPIDPQKELWYFIPASSSIPCQLPWPLACQRGDSPPPVPPTGVITIIFAQNCND